MIAALVPVGSRVVVGLDGSPASIAALVWALRASAGEVPIEVVTAWPDPAQVFVHEVPGHFCLPRHAALQAQRAALDRARAVVDPVADIRTHLLNQHPVDALVSRCTMGDLLVVGASRRLRGREADGETVDRLCLLRAPCPVAVVDLAPGGDPWSDLGEVVVRTARTGRPEVWAAPNR